MVNIKDVAKHAGVSIATVSRVVNNTEYVSPDIREKVYKAIDELGYYPNSLARSLKNDTSFTIGFLVSDISNPYFTTIAKAVEDVINKEGYNLIVCSTENEKKRELEYLKLLAGKKVDGLIINTTGENDEIISNMSREDFRVILVDRRIDNSKFTGDFISHDNVAGSYTLTSHLLSLGHRKIGIINGSLKVSSGKERFAGFKKAMEQYGISVDDSYPYRYDGDFTLDAGYKGAEKFMSMDDKATAVIAMNNQMAKGVLRYFRQNEIKVPDSISMASYGDIETAELLYVRPTIVAQEPRIIGTRAGEMLLERIAKGNALNNREIMYLPQLIIRDTTKAI